MKNRGFTLVEALVAVSILVTAITGPLVLASRGVNASNFIRDQVVAYQLAQEAIETVRAVRDRNSLSGFPWLQGLDGTSCRSPGACTCTPPNRCVVDGLADIEPEDSLIESYRAVFQCGTPTTCPKLQQLDISATGERIYGQSQIKPRSGYVNSIYTREVRIEPISNTQIVGGPAEARITVTMNWVTNGVEQTLSVSENILDWK